MAQLEHVVAFLSRESDGIFKDEVAKIQNVLVELRSLLFFLLIVCSCALTDCTRRLLQFTTTFPTLQQRTSGPSTRTARQMAPITISAIRSWARLTSRMRAAYSRSTLSHSTCSLMPAWSSIPSSSVKRFQASCHLAFHQLTCVVLVRRAPGRIVQLYVLICSACHPYVRSIACFFGLAPY